MAFFIIALVWVIGIFIGSGIPGWLRMIKKADNANKELPVKSPSEWAEVTSASFSTTVSTEFKGKVDTYDVLGSIPSVMTQWLDEHPEMAGKSIVDPGDYAIHMHVEARFSRRKAAFR